jgi:transposase-like protein
MKNTYRYSEAFKLRVIRAIEDGEVENLNQARQKYGIRGAGTAESWIRKYGKNQMLGKVIRVENADEQNELKRLCQEIMQLKETLADNTVDLAIERAYTEMLGEAAGIDDLEAFKKKAVTKRRGRSE